MSSRHRNVSEGDWICSDPKCENLNFARRSSCNRCGKNKSYSKSSKKQGAEIGKAAAEKSHGLFSAQDWQCSKCGNVNWARRSTCNVCNAPKINEEEERTGYGGGFNEREGLEYIQRDDSEDEYDDYGRKKKKFRNATLYEGDSHLKEKEDEPQRDSPEVSNDEDDDEDGDLSKYDLWGEEDDDEENNKKPQNSKNGKHGEKSKSPSKSRSRSSSISSASYDSDRSSSSDSSRRYRSSSSSDGRRRSKSPRDRSR